MPATRTRARSEGGASAADAHAPAAKLPRNATRSAALLGPLAPAAAQHASPPVPTTVVSSGSPIPARPVDPLAGRPFVSSVLGRAAQLANQANPGIARLGSPGSPVPAFAVPKPKAPSAPSLL